jgi:PBSX family phage portal protein
VIILTKKADSFIVTVDDNDEYHVINKLELDKHALKADVDTDGSKQTVDEMFKVGTSILNPKYNPYDLVKLLDLYTYHASCVEAVAIDSTGVDYTLKPVEDVEPVEIEKERFYEVLDNSKPSINTNLQRMIYDRRSIGYGALEIIREDNSKSDIIRLKHIPAHTLRRHTDLKRVLHITPSGKRVWFVIYGKNYDKNGVLSDVNADTGEFHPYNSLPADKKANEILWSMEYAPGTDYYGRPPIVSCLGSIKGDIGAVKYNNSFFENYGMPKFAITVTGDFADYDEEPEIDDGEGHKIPNPDYDITQTLRYKIGQQIKEVIRNPHSAICITIPSEGEEGNVELKITPLSVQAEEGHFRMYRKDTRDEVIHAHHMDPSRLGIFDTGNLNGTNSQVTRNSYKYGTITPIKSECEALINQIGLELGVTSWKFCIEDVAPIDYTKDLALAEFLFQRGAMTIRELIENFGSKFGLTIEDVDDYYLNARYMNYQPLEQIWNQTENNPNLEMDSILGTIEDTLRGDTDDDISGNEKETNSITRDTEKVTTE